jgi:hypothetical protein
MWVRSNGQLFTVKYKFVVNVKGARNCHGYQLSTAMVTSYLLPWLPAIYCRSANHDYHSLSGPWIVWQLKLMVLVKKGNCKKINLLGLAMLVWVWQDLRLSIHTWTWQTQMEAGHPSVNITPQVITHRPPHVVIADFNPSFCAGTISQPDCSINAALTYKHNNDGQCTCSAKILEGVILTAFDLRVATKSTALPTECTNPWAVKESGLIPSTLHIAQPCTLTSTVGATQDNGN